MLILAFLACSAPDVGETGAIDTGDTGGARAPLDVPCDLQAVGSEFQWGGWLEGVRVHENGCDGEDEETCALTGAWDEVVAETHYIEAARWVTGFDRIRNDPADPTRSFAMVHTESAGIDDCRITLY